ncbi:MULTISPECIES: hypothetical protein [Roseomonadaceae]|uniref:Uncharacterized protein n=1 Tax=Falsiroseomonas oleicola TaxID=2801474 RepID=A0ABS6HCE3_9PROT|nr:hypothetical protein [Roseomonas oleicola]MBU8546397.1 hypothetical protein [Roseomonas oleicola]
MRHWQGLPGLIRFLLVQMLVGFGLAGLAVLGLLVADPGDARALLLRAAGHWWPVVLLWGFLGSTFTAVQIGVAIALMAEAPPRPPPRGRGIPNLWVAGPLSAYAPAWSRCARRRSR